MPLDSLDLAARARKLKPPEYYDAISEDYDRRFDSGSSPGVAVADQESPWHFTNHQARRASRRGAERRHLNDAYRKR